MDNSIELQRKVGNLENEVASLKLKVENLSSKKNSKLPRRPKPAKIRSVRSGIFY